MTTSSISGRLMRCRKSAPQIASRSRIPVPIQNDLQAATRTPTPQKLTQLLTQLDVWEASAKDEPEPQVLKLEDFRRKGGDGIRTHDVQLGKLAFYH